MDKKQNNVISLPCLRGKIGDWMYYVTLLSFSEVASRVKQPEEIDKKYENDELKLGEWIQRKISPSRIRPIVNYIKEQEQQFFNSLVLGIYDGEPTWQDINFSVSSGYYENETNLDYVKKTFGILTLSGKESIFAIDGQHRASGIRKAVQEGFAVRDSEIPVIFIAHSTTEQGLIRTRRMFSTLNRYAKPVSESEKIALSEDDNCAIITRKLVDEHEYLKGTILLNKSRSIHPSQTKYFTSIMVLYDIVNSILVKKKIACYGVVDGKDSDSYNHTRETDNVLEKDYKFVSGLITLVINKIPELSDFFMGEGTVERNNPKSSLLFRPIAQNILFDVVKVAIFEKKLDQTLDYFASINFSIDNKIWRKIFWNDDTNTITTDKPRQRYATILILEKLGISVKRTKTDLEVYNNFGLSVSDI